MRSFPLFVAAAVAALSAGALEAQTYEKEVVLDGLDRPTGITVAPNGAVYFTEVPTPGVFGGRNRVARHDPATGDVSTVSAGEPYPINLAYDDQGNLYWTCQTAGVVFRRDAAGSKRIWRAGLDQPTGIAAGAEGRIYWTQVPTPGVPGSAGGRNTVDLLDSRTARRSMLSEGEPEPADVAAAANGDAYWTCRTAGVLLKYDGATGAKTVVLDGLAQPTGLAMDAQGNLYFTEVPMPGVFGGDNKVWKFDPVRRALTLISAGEPEPVDIAVVPDGSTVYWTCRTAGVIFRATRTGDAPTIEANGTMQPGSSVAFAMRDAGSAGRSYVAASSLGLGPIGVDGRFLALDADGLFAATAGGATSIVSGYAGMLDGTGAAEGQLMLPNLSGLSGLRVFTAFVVLDPTAPSGVRSISDTTTFAIR